MSKLIFVSNRLPVTVEKRKGSFRFRESVGGLATGLGSLEHANNSVWVGWSGIPSESLTTANRREIETTLEKEHNCHNVLLSRRDLKMYYQGFCNKTIWPLFHYFTECPVHDQKHWEHYKHVNHLFCRHLMEVVKPGDTIWVHDYQLMLLPGMIREKMPDAAIGYFHHIPFPSFEIYRILPWRLEILRGLLGADLIGFHTHDYVRHFLSSVRRLLGHEHVIERIMVDNRIVRVDAFPMGINFEKYAGAARLPEVQKEIKKNRKKIRDSAIILSVDRLDYTKGIPERLEAFDAFLKRHPEFREKVTLILVAVPSRTTVETYVRLRRQVEELVGRINGTNATIGWNPVWYLYRSLPFHTLSAFYHLADVALVTPVRDGMNLIAKEYVAARRDKKGVLILSEMAGAASEMGEAIIVNPKRKENVADAIYRALTMDAREQIKHNTIMQERLKRYNVSKWAGDFMQRLDQVKQRQKRLLGKKLSPKVQKQLLRDYRKSQTRLLFLDYDGTLISFASTPEKARPDKKLLQLLNRISRKQGNELVLISGRDKQTLENWFGSLEVNLVAEHGVWLKRRGGDWFTMESLKEDWKREIRPILDLYVDRTPGALLEEKDFSLVWHYRRVDSDLASIRVAELKDNLIHLTENRDLEIMDGNKVIEIKHAGINKGSAALRWLNRRKWDFIMAVGDDVTDEDIFLAVPDDAYTIKVGLHLSRARYNLDSYRNVRNLLEELTGKNR